MNEPDRPVPPPLAAAERRALRARAHALKPVVTVGALGLTDAVLAELDAALEHHELVKVRLGSDDRAERAGWAETLCARLGARLVQSIGKIAVVHRQAAERDSR